MRILYATIKMVLKKEKICNMKTLETRMPVNPKARAGASPAPTIRNYGNVGTGS